ASTGRRDAASTKRTKSASRHHASTVETSIRPPGRQAVTSRKLASDDRVVFTMNSRSRSAKRDLDQSATACSASLTMTTSDATPAARKFRITDSISGTPAMGTIGFGTVKPAWRRRLPSPAAMMPPRSGGALTGGAPRGPSASGSPGRLGSRDPRVVAHTREVAVEVGHDPEPSVAREAPEQGRVVAEVPERVVGRVEQRVEPLALDGDALVTEEPVHALFPGEPVGVERSAEVEQHRG